MAIDHFKDTQKPVLVSELKQDDMPFLLKIWHIPEVMRYADEFPGLRGWSKSDAPEVAWEKYLERRASLGIDYTQLILQLEDGTSIGEAFFTPLSEASSFGKWQKPDQVNCLVGDIKLEPTYWKRGLGTAGMRRVVQFAFGKTSCGLFVVPPHLENPAAYRVYEKSGFLLFTGMKSWRSHRVMEMTRARFAEIYEDVS